MDVDGLRAYAEELHEQLQRLTDNSSTISRKLSELTGVATSPDRYVTVTVDAKGKMLSLELDPRIYRNEDSVALARVITETADRAHDDATKKTEEILRPFMSQEEIDAHLSGDSERIMRQFEDKLTFEGGHQ